MGEDIHQRIYIKHRSTGKYVNAHEICDWSPREGSLFEELVPGRNYNMFSLFGSNRGEYQPLDRAQYGMPDFLRGTVFDEYCISMNYYGFTWFKLPDFSKSVKEYLETVRNPLKYLDKDTSAYEDWHELVSRTAEKIADRSPTNVWYDKLMASYEEWLDYHREIINGLKKIDETLARFLKIDDWCRTYNKIFDINETVFLFFFDN